MPALSTPRLHHLDAARAVLLLLGIPFHVATTATMILSPGLPGWVADPAVGVGLSFIHSFRMSAFFILAGYFSGMASARRGRRRWLHDRMMRVALPLVASVATLALVQYRLKVMLSVAWANGYRGLPVAFEHLWFLVVLLAYVFLYALRPRMARVPDPMLRPLLGLDRGTWPLALLALAAWGAALAITIQAFDLHDNEAWFEEQLLLRTLQYLPAFLLGALAWRLKLGDRLFAFHGYWPWAVVPPLMAAHFLLDPLVRPHLGWTENPPATLQVVDSAIAGALAYAMALVVFRTLAALFGKRHHVIAFLVEGAMAIYLFHMIIAMLVILTLARLGGTGSPAPTLQWLGLSGLVFGLAVLCFMAVRRVPLLALLFCGTGLKQPAPPHSTAQPQAPKACNPGERR